jgi:hypothetical protein
MFFDLCFFGLPMAAAILLGTNAWRNHNVRLWRACGCFTCYCLFYLAGGREAIAYVTCLAMMGGIPMLGGNI